MAMRGESGFGHEMGLEKEEKGEKMEVNSQRKLRAEYSIIRTTLLSCHTSGLCPTTHVHCSDCLYHS